MQDGDNVQLRLEQLEDRFDEHVQIYKENKEEIRENNRLVKQLLKEFKDNREAIQWLKRVKWGKHALAGIVAFLGTLVGFVLGVKELIFG